MGGGVRDRTRARCTVRAKLCGISGLGMATLLLLAAPAAAQMSGGVGTSSGGGGGSSTSSSMPATITAGTSSDSILGSFNNVGTGTAPTRGGAVDQSNPLAAYY